MPDASTLPTAAPAPAPAAAVPPLVVHVVDRLGVGGMENGLVNIINGTPPDRFRHAVICLREAGAFRKRLRDPSVPVLVAGKKPGKDPLCYLRLWRMLRRLKPAVVHTRNLPAVDMVVPARFCGAAAVVHGEHGRDAVEEDGANPRYNRLRRTLSPLVDRYVVVSRDIEQWLADRVGVPAEKVTQIYNGVDAQRFHPAAGGRRLLPPPGFAGPRQVVIGTVGRMQTVKDQVTLARAFVHILEKVPEARSVLRLVMIGDGPLRQPCMEVLAAAGAQDLAWLPGSRDDIPEILRGLDVFVLPSRTEGICNTILEAMASGLPVVATHVGGNPELVQPGETGALAPPSDAAALAAALVPYVTDAALRRAHGAAGRRRVLAEFALERMVGRYLDTYDALLAGVEAARADARPATAADGRA